MWVVNVMLVGNPFPVVCISYSITTNALLVLPQLEI